VKLKLRFEGAVGGVLGYAGAEGIGLAFWICLGIEIIQRRKACLERVEIEDGKFVIRGLLQNIVISFHY